MQLSTPRYMQQESVHIHNKRHGQGCSQQQLFVIVPNQKQSQCPSATGWKNNKILHNNDKELL